MGEVLNNGVYLPDRGERNAYDGLKGNWNTLDNIAGKVSGYDGHISDTDIHVTAADKQTWNGKADASHVHNANDVTTGVFDAARIPNLDASKITTGTIDIDRLPQGALERLVKVADQAARYALTAADVQLGDTVQQLDTGVMYVVTDETKLDSADGYTEYTAGSATSVPWSGVTGKPADYTPASHSHGNITNDGKVGTAANKPLITGTDGVVQAGAFGNQANTFCEGNDSRLSDARTPVAHVHGNIANDGKLTNGNRAVITGSDKAITESSVTDTELGYVAGVTSAIQTQLNTKAADTDVVHKTGTESIAGDKTWSANNQFAKINTIETNTVEWHNSHYRGINLISDGHFADMAALLTAIRAQDWSDIYIGDYVELTFTYEGASRTVKFYVGEIDKFYKVGDASLETHHLVMVTGDLGINQVMNDTNTTAGGYVGSKAHTVTLPALYAILNPLFNNAILTHREHLSNTVLSAQTVSLSLNDGNGAVNYSCNNFPVYSSGDPNTPGCVTSGAWYDCNLVLMSEIEMFGSNRFASSGLDDIMCPEGQIAAFKYNRNLQTLNRTINTWLRNVNSASRFCICSGYGNSLRIDATATYIRLRPRFLIG